MAYESASFREHNEVRIPTLNALLDLGWSRGQIICPSPDGEDREWRVPCNPSAAALREQGKSYKGFPVDIAIFDTVEGAGDPQHLLAIIECKLPHDESGMSELETYLGLEPHARMGVLTNGVLLTRTYKLANGEYSKVRNATLPTPTENFICAEHRVMRADMHVPTEEELRQVFERILNVVVSSDGTSTRADDRLNQVCNLLLLKLQYDTSLSHGQTDAVEFQIRDDQHATAAWVQHAFGYYCRRNQALFADDEARVIRLDDATIHAAVFELQCLNLVDVKPAALSFAFQVFRSANLKVGEGQYFTPLKVIEAGTKMMEITSADRVIDPACGTGGFLSEAFMMVRSAIGDRDASRWASKNLCGVDLDDINVKLVRALMVGIGDGSTNAFVGDSLRQRKWQSDPCGLSNAMRDGSYSVVLTNPPFGQGLKLSVSDAREARYTICERPASGRKGKTYMETELGIVFVERAWRLLEEGGRLGIVLPETYFFSKTYEWFRQWLDEHFDLRGVLNIPMEAFQGFCRAKTNFYVFEKKGRTCEPPSIMWFSHDSVWVSDAATIGINKDGGELYELDPLTRERTNRVDNKALQDVNALVAGGADTPTSRFVPASGVSTSLVGVPRYSDRRTLADHDAWIKAKLPDCGSASLGELDDWGYLAVRGGHGSPSADMRGGGIPYIKVSDLRNGQVNPNTTNMVSTVVAQRYWKGNSSGLHPYDILTPARASKNIGEPSLLLPGQERVVLTKEILVFSVCDEAPFDSFYLMWALSNPHVLAQWERVIFMQTNREDVGGRWREIAIPLPPSRIEAGRLARPYRDYYQGLGALRGALKEALRTQDLQ